MSGRQEEFVQLQEKSGGPAVVVQKSQSTSIVECRPQGSLGSIFVLKGCDKAEAPSNKDD